MPKFEVKYTTNERPTGLPADAVITQVSSLPLNMKTSYSKRDVVIRKDIFDDSIYMSIHTAPVTSISPDEARQIIDALTEAIEGMPSTDPKKVKDRSGDIWERQPNGKYSFRRSYGLDTGSWSDWSLARLKADIGPVTVVEA